jgi:hypothetical protein
MISFAPQSWTPCKAPMALEFNNGNPGGALMVTDARRRLR